MKKIEFVFYSELMPHILYKTLNQAKVNALRDFKSFSSPALNHSKDIKVWIWAKPLGHAFTLLASERIKGRWEDLNGFEKK